ncbi:hypothetical protein KEM54_006992 [Ascosphaera aggregata]|nr:hypothetical protein KEM54_006992 [Ascosphaera aggregata]
MPAPSLLKLATAVCARNVKKIDDVGDAPYFLVRPILMRVENPEHLHQIELKSPHLVEDTSELWLEFIKRDIPRSFQSGYVYFNTNVNVNVNDNDDDDDDDDDGKITSSADKPCYTVYKTLTDESQRQFENDAQRMLRALQETSKKKELLKTKIIDVKPSPQQRNRGGGGSSRQSMRSTIARCVARDRRMMMMTGITEPKKPFQLPKPPSRKMSTPTHLLNKGLGTVTQAPKGLVEAYKPVTTQQPAASPGTNGTAGAARRTIVAGSTRPSSSTIQRRTVARTSSSSRRGLLEGKSIPSSSSNPSRTSLRDPPRITKPTASTVTTTSSSLLSSSHTIRRNTTASTASPFKKPTTLRSVTAASLSSTVSPRSAAATAAPGSSTAITRTRESSRRQVSGTNNSSSSPAAAAAAAATASTAAKRTGNRQPQSDTPPIRVASGTAPARRIVFSSGSPSSADTTRRALDKRKRDDRAEQQQQQRAPLKQKRTKKTKYDV